MAKVELNAQQLWIDGQVDFANADMVLQQGLMLLKQHTQFPLAVNLSKLQQGNSLVLAIFIQWLRTRPQAGDLYLLDVPEKMQGIIRASNLQQLTCQH